MKRPNYAFEDFVEDFENVNGILRKDSGEGQEFDSTTVRVMDYMTSKHADELVSRYKWQRLMSIMHYVATRFDEFDQGDFAVYGSEKVGGLVGEHLLRAVHHIYTMGRLPTNDPMPKEVMALAEECRVTH